MTLIDSLKALLSNIFADCSWIKVESVEQEEGYETFSALFHVETDLTDEDFDVDIDEDNPRYSTSHFTESNLGDRASQSLFHYLVNNNKVDFVRVATITLPSGTDKTVRRTVLKFALRPTDDIRFGYNRRPMFDVFAYDDLGFDICDAIYDKEPSIVTHYSPMKVRGVMDADPEEYDYECSPESVVVPIYITFRFW